MGVYVLENETLLLTINSFGAEMVSLKEKSSEQEYLWNADERYWKRYWDPKWYLSAFPTNEVNKGYGLVQNPGW